MENNCDINLEEQAASPGIDNITRCPECNLISSLNLNYQGGKPMINYLCENNHKGNISLDEYLQKYNTHSLSKQKCEECNKAQNEAKGDYFYCSLCKKFLCYSCLLKHPNNGKHNTINYNRYDSYCKTHSNSFCSYCTKCKKNICVYCDLEHESHEKINLSKFNYKEESKKKLEEDIKKIEKKITDLDIIKEEIILEIDKLKKANEAEMKFFKLLISTYKYRETQNNINYNVIQNLKCFEENFGLNKIQFYGKIFLEGKKYIQYLRNLRQNISETNLLKTNFKTLNNHTSMIDHLSILKDGRLISSSNDNTLNIYKKDTYELQLSIKEHSSYVRFVKQLNNGNIITCSDDQSMNIIKLIDENKYNLEQKLTGHRSLVWNVIEIRDNELVSVSYDKTMKKWEIKNNKYECTKTINFQNSNSYCYILKINENEFVTSSYGDKCLKFWNLNDYSNISTINNIESNWSSRILFLIKEDILCVGCCNSKGFYLINISNHQLIKNIIGPKTIYSISRCFDGLILCSIINENGNNAIVKYKYENQDLKKIVEREKVHDDDIYTCVELNDGTIASGSRDKLIKLWRN